MKRILLIAVLLLTACGGLGGQGSAPRLDPIDDVYGRVNEKLSFLVTAADPDGGELTFKIAGRPPAAQFIALDDGHSALFTWTPEVTDSEADGKEHVVEFFVLDRDGHWDSQEVTITVMPQAAAQFLNPPGYVLDLSEENAIEFLVQVKDDAATQVDIAVAEGPVGAYLEQSGKKQAYFFWRPTQEQIAEKLFWYVRFRATGYAPDPTRAGQEHQLYQITHDIAIVITNPDYAGCPGKPPVLEHPILADQHPAFGDAGYPISVEVNEVDSEVQKVEVYWTTGSPGNDEAFSSIALTSADGSNFSGHLPKVNAGQGMLVHYFIKAWDNDDYAGATCDHVVRLPKEGHFTFVAYDPGADGVCMDDAYEPNDHFEDAYFFMDPGAYPSLRICGDDVDYFGFAIFGAAVKVTVQAFGNGNDLYWQAQDGMGNPVAGMQSGSASVSVTGGKLSGGVLLVRAHSNTGAPVTFDLLVTPEAGECKPDSLESNDSPAEAELIGEGSFQDLTICAGDEDWFRLEVPAGTLLSATATHAAQEGDLDLYLYGSDGTTPLDSAETSSKEETVEANILSGGTHYLKVAGFQGASNSYNLSVSFEQQTENCQEDSFAPNQYVDEAIMVPPSLYKQLVACPGKEDWFAIGLNGGETLSVTVSPGSGLGLHLENSEGTLLCTGKSVSGGIGFDCTIPAPGNYRFRVFNQGYAAAYYDLDVAVEDPPGPCQDDRFENNDTVGNGAEILYSTTTWLKACGTNEDWFYFQGFSQDQVFVGLVFDPADGNVEVLLYDPSGLVPLAASDSAHGMPYLEVGLSGSGFYNLLVQGSNPSANVPYNLFVWIN
jgi:hypothetical protein